jgi:amino acid transporter
MPKGTADMDETGLRIARMASAGLVLKRLLVGRQVATYRLEHTFLPKVLALPIFSSDALSSVAYATEEILLVLVSASLAARNFVFPISIAIAVLMVTVVASYRQTIRAYPSGGGAYVVSKENLGVIPGLVAAAALLVDYVLTVSVSVAAGVFAITSAAPGLSHLRVPMSFGFVAFITLVNLRGVREAGVLFALPTYAFITTIFVMLVTGVARCVGGCPQAVTETPVELGLGAAGLLVILHAFSSGSTALTGVEAISNAVTAFRRPQWRNAARTLVMMAVVAIAMFLGISYLALRTGALPSHEQSVVSQIAAAVFQGDLGFYAVQITTAAILILAANTAYQGFPRLSAILGRDRFLPRQFENLGDRLVYSNGIVVLAVFAALLIWAFDANVSDLIQLYVVGVFTAFTLSQAGMVRHWLAKRGKGWQRSIVINGVGAFATGVVLVVIAATKFSHGAWIVIVAMPILVLVLLGVRRHYDRVHTELHRGLVSFGEVGANRVVLVLTDVNAAASEALGYIRSFRPSEVRTIYVGPRAPAEVQVLWDALARGASRVDFLEGDDRVDAVLEYIRRIPREPTDFITVVIPELFRRRSLLHAIRPVTFRLKVRLLKEPQVVVTDVPVLTQRGRLVGVDARPLPPERTSVIVFVSSVHDAAVRAVNYARSLRGAETRAVCIALDAEEARDLPEAWNAAGINVQLDIVDAPFRDLGPPVMEEVRRITRDPEAIAAVILPEFVVSKWWQGILHNQRALFIKRQLLFEPRVILSSVPYPLR